MGSLLGLGIYTYLAGGGSLTVATILGYIFYKKRSRKKLLAELEANDKRIKEKSESKKEEKETIGTEIESIESVRSELLSQIEELKKQVQEKQTPIPTSTPTVTVSGATGSSDTQFSLDTPQVKSKNLSTGNWTPAVYKSTPGKPIGWAGPRGISKLGRLPSRMTSLRRQIYKQVWHEKLIYKDQSGTVTFFKELSNDCRVSNMEVTGCVSPRQSMLIKKIILRFPFGANQADKAEILDKMVLRVMVGRDTANTFVMPTSTTPEINPTSATFDLGQLPLGPGQNFAIEMYFSKKLNMSEDMRPTIVLETIVDEPIS